jgi:hypothetical protein
MVGTSEERQLPRFANACGHANSLAPRAGADARFSFSDDSPARLQNAPLSTTKRGARMARGPNAANKFGFSDLRDCRKILSAETFAN